MLTLTVLAALVLGADLTEAERELLAGLSEPERLYVQYAVTHMTDGDVDASNGASLDVGDAGKLIAAGVDMQVVDPENMILTDSRGTSVWLSGAKAEADDQNLNLHLPKGLVVVVVGSKSYTTAIGAMRTVRHLAVVNLERVQPFVEQVLEGRGMRTWTISKRECRAAFQSSSSRWINLKSPSGDSRRVARADLSESDRKWIIEELRRRAAERKK